MPNNRRSDIDGENAAKTHEYQQQDSTSVGALYNVGFTVKMSRKFTGSDYTVTKLEGLWWLDDGVAEPTATTTISLAGESI